jgi:AcrR family transcriptional regulator
MAKEPQITKAQQREATIARLIDVAYEVFTRDGYAHASTEEIVRLAGVTRGALYHHFVSKEGLFKAVLAFVQQQVGLHIATVVAEEHEIWEQLIKGCVAFLEISADPHVRQIMLIDAPAVVGWSLWREMDAENSMKSLHEALTELALQGQLPPLPINALTHLLSGAMNESALWIAQSDDSATALVEATQALTYILHSLRQTK